MLVDVLILDACAASPVRNAAWNQWISSIDQTGSTLPLDGGSSARALRVAHVIGDDNEDRALQGMTGVEIAALFERFSTDPIDVLVLDSCVAPALVAALRDSGCVFLLLPARLGREEADVFLDYWYAHLARSESPIQAFTGAFELCACVNLPIDIRPQLIEKGLTSEAHRSNGAVRSMERVFFATNRLLEDDQWSAKASMVCNFGRCDVAVDAQIGGRTERATLGRGGLKSEVTTRDDFAADVEDAIDSSRSRSRAVLVYIHGYRTSFAEAAARAGQLHADVGASGATVFFAWPSKGRGGSYLADGDAVQTAEDQLYELLIYLQRMAVVDKVHILAHSMGSRAIVRVIRRAADRQALDGLKVGQLLFAAPDVDVHSFAAAVASFEAVADGTTVYMSKRDKALRGSGILHEGERAGFDFTPSPGSSIWTVDTGNVDSSLLGHGYYSSSVRVLQHFNHLLTTGDPSSSWGAVEVHPNSLSLRS